MRQRQINATVPNRDNWQSGRDSGLPVLPGWNPQLSRFHFLGDLTLPYYFAWHGSAAMEDRGSRTLNGIACGRSIVFRALMPTLDRPAPTMLGRGGASRLMRLAETLLRGRVAFSRHVDATRFLTGNATNGFGVEGPAFLWVR